MLVTRTSELRPHQGITDYITDGKCKLGSEWIPCRIGYNEYTDCFGETDIEPRYVFISDGITPNGNHYERRTIDIASCIMVGI